ncbi:hypothetical protein [Gorillibacterium timonense]|uniref:hypothetical protein n=1 Tax=Gorillibacterium timonense TaxID=1689269 RepID=UPI00071CD647|nr:hypothetical protein [Gorillibacterium timonense]
MTLQPDKSRTLEELLDPGYPLCRDDVIWAIHALKQKAAEGNVRLPELPRPRLMRNYYALAELSLLLLHPASGKGMEQKEWKALLREASHGMRDADR